MALGKQVKKHRTFRGWTLEALEDRSGVPAGTISALEVRDSQRSKYAPALAKAFGISVEQLLDEAYDPASTSQKKSEIPAGEKWPFPISYERFLTIGSDIKDAVDMILIAAVEPTPISPDMYKKVTDAFSRATLAMLSDRPSQAGRRKGKRRAA